MSKSYAGQLARELHSQRRLRDAEAAYRLALYDHPEDGELYLGLAECLRAQGRRADALDAYVAAIDFAPDRAEAYYGLGECEMHPLRRAEAFSEAIAADPDHVYAHVGLGGSLLMLGRLDEALGWLRHARRLAPDDLALACRAGELLAEHRYHAEAVVFFEQAIAEHPIGDHSAAGLGYLYRGLGRSLQSLHQSDDAEEAFRAAAYLLPGPTDDFAAAIGEATDPDNDRTDPSVSLFDDAAGDLTDPAIPHL